MKCDCINKVNEKLKGHNLELKLQMTIDLNTMETGTDLAIETVSTKKGVKPQKLFPPFCQDTTENQTNNPTR